jgi:hypothetical protein
LLNTSRCGQRDRSSRPSPDERPGRAVLNWLWLALSDQKMGNTDEARR